MTPERRRELAKAFLYSNSSETPITQLERAFLELEREVREGAIEECATVADKYADEHPNYTLEQTAMRGAIRYAVEAIRGLKGEGE